MIIDALGPSLREINGKLWLASAMAKAYGGSRWYWQSLNKLCNPFQEKNAFDYQRERRNNKALRVFFRAGSISM